MTDCYFKGDWCTGSLRVILNLLNEVGNDLCVGLGHELMTLVGELALQFKIIFDDAVMDDDKPA